MSDTGVSALVSALQLNILNLRLVLMNGTAQIVSGFISFGTLHISTPGLAPWQWLYIITGIITLLTAVAYWCVTYLVSLAVDDLLVVGISGSSFPTHRLTHGSLPRRRGPSPSLALRRIRPVLRTSISRRSSECPHFNNRRCNKLMYFQDD